MKHKVLAIVCLFSLSLLLGCVTPTTENPLNPELDDPFILGPEVTPPSGCIEWQERDGVENADC
jgi:hypothetical protein